MQEQPQLAQMLGCVTTESWTATASGSPEALGVGWSRLKTPVWLFLSWMGTGVETVHVLTEESPRGGPYWVLQVTRNSRKAFTLVRVALYPTQAPDQGFSLLSSHLCPQFKPLQCLDGCCQHQHHWQRSYSPWRAGDAVPRSTGPFPWGVVSHSPELCPEPAALLVGKQGGW